MSTQERWLVKAAGQILGPLSRAEIEASIKKKEFGGIDEVSVPFGRWHYMRDDEVLSKIFIALKNKEEFLDGHTVTDTGSETSTETLTASMSEGFVNVTGFGSHDRLLKGIQEQLEESKSKATKQKSPDAPVHADSNLSPEMFKRAREEAPMRATSPPATVGSSHASLANASTKTYVPSGQDVSQKTKTPLWAWGASLGLLILLAVIAYVQNQNAPGRRSPDSFDSLTLQALKEKGLGDWDSAKTKFLMALERKPGDVPTTLELAPILIEQLDAVTAKRQLKDLLPLGLDVDQRKKALNYLALAHMKTYDYDRALEYLQEALAMDPGFFAALHNRASILFLKEAYAEAYNSLKKIFESKQFDYATLFLLGEIALAIRKKGGARAETLPLSNALALIDENRKEFFDHRQELIVLSSYLRFFASEADRASAIEQMEGVLDEDPVMSEEFIPNLDIYRERTRWAQLVGWIRDMQSRSTGSPRLNAVLGLGLFKGQDKTEGRTVIEDSRKRNSLDPLLLGMASYVAEGRPEESIVDLRLSLENMASQKLPAILMARYCERRSDYRCAREYWNKVIGLVPGYPSAVAGLAAALQVENKSLEGAQLIQKYRRLALNYRPYLKYLSESR